MTHRRYTRRPCMPGYQSTSQRLLRALALTTASYNTLHFMWGQMELSAVHRIINRGIYETYGATA